MCVCVCLLVCVCVSMCMNVYVSVLKVCMGVSNTLQCILHMTVQSSVEVCIEVCSVHFLFCFCCCFLQVLFLLFLLFGLGLGHPVIFHLKTFYWAWLVNNTIVYCSDLKTLKLQKGKYFHCSEDTVVYLISLFFFLLLLHLIGRLPIPHPTPVFYLIIICFLVLYDKV